MFNLFSDSCVFIVTMIEIGEENTYLISHICNKSLLFVFSAAEE